MGRPKTYDEALRNRLLDEAGKMLSSEGYSSVSLRTLTTLAETSTNAVYTLFGSKEALMAEVILNRIEEALKPINEAAEQQDPLKALVDVAHGLRSFALSQPNLFEGAFDAMAEARKSNSLTERFNPAVREIDKQMLAPIKTVCERIAETSDVLDLCPTRMSMILWAALHGYLVLEIAGLLPEEGGDTDEVFDELLVALTRGWVAGDLGDLVVSQKQQA